LKITIAITNKIIIFKKQKIRDTTRVKVKRNRTSCFHRQVDEG